jgi:choline dehydrogenase-like flavoprotein
VSRSNDNPDVIIVGSGFAGLAIAQELTAAGVKVTVLEQGPPIHDVDHPTLRDDWEWAALREWNFSPNVRGLEQDYPVVTGDSFRPYMYNAVGGSTNHYGGWWHRMKPVDFRKGTEHGLEGTIDWPISYEDLAPYYDLNDRYVGISGLPGDPGYPPRPDAHRLPPLKHGNYYELLMRGFDRLGWHWWVGDNAIISQPYDGRMGCNLNGFCPMGCPRGSLGTAWQAFGRRAMLNGMDLRANTRVLRVTVDSSGAANGVEYADRVTGSEHRLNAPLVVVACNGIGSPRLLLNSPKNGEGTIGNSHDQVGRHLLLHGYICGDLWFDESTEHYKGPFGLGMYCQEFYDTDPARGCVNGITFSLGTGYGPAAAAFGGTAGSDVAPWGKEHHREFERRFDHNVFFAIQVEDIPLPDSRVTLDPDATDSSGIPAARADYKGHENDKKILRFGIERMKELAEAADARSIDIESIDEYSPHGWHLMGTCRMGDDRENSVVDSWHRAWDTPGLIVCDGSSMTTSGAGNPTATIGALALRCADGILRNRNRRIEAEPAATAS